MMHVIRVSLNEQQFIKTLVKLKKRIQECYLKGPWIGITEPGTIGAPEGFNLWVVLPEEVLGSYWYKVRSFATPMTPQATLAPALPVVLLSSWPPFPKSSGSA
ncbi:unnamed protein product [Acanthoscelides obtectus]|uniref:Uncharacterized protein n=1 Tax=Acanthoscelides obtectus TaxID=200917 RepID=A0A9P0LDZ3_ACAOB|nr:unnamed protein product [Acanthoscelides obtectus]CAK1655211.1 hypothetical protein AOBTE_LOCUS19082 [Acanthoscelides obtectus]